MESADRIASLPDGQLRGRFEKEFTASFHAARLLSARLAERSAKQFYSEAGCTVRDISLHQLTNESQEWRTHDLLVDGKPLDVKSARSSYSSTGAYSEHCVREFKRRGSQDIALAGVFSRYEKLPVLMDGTGVEFVYLGEATAESIQRAAERTKDFGAGALDIRVERGTLSFVPAWAFHVDDRFMLPLDGDVADDLVKKLRSQDGHVLALGCLALVGVGASERQKLKATHAHLSIIERVQELQRRVALDRPTQFMAVLREVVGMIARGETDILPLMDCIYAFSPVEGNVFSRWPLGVYDPLATSWNMLNAFQTALTRNPGALAGFVTFRLNGLSILQGQKPSGEWNTVLAHCGGWRLSNIGGKARPRAKCGKTPLMLGLEQSCSCGKLICSACGYCSNSCSQCNARQLAMASRAHHLDMYGSALD